MKKILALALVLVLALGMMVPVFAKSEIETHNSTGNPIDDVGEIAPDWYKSYLIDFAEFTLSTDAKTAISNATPKTIQSVMDRIAKTISVKTRARKGGALMDVSIDGAYCNNTTSVFYGTLTEIQTGLNKINAIWFIGGQAPVLADLDNETTFDNYLKNKVQLKMNVPAEKKAYDQAIALYRSYLGKSLDPADWSIIILVEAPEVPWISISDVDFEVDILMHIGGRSDNEWYLTVLGTLCNEVIEVDADYTYANSYDGHIIEAIEYVPKIAICGNYDDDVYAHVKMAKDKKIIFVVTTESDMADEGIFDKYPAIEFAYKVQQIGLNSYTGNFIELGAVDNTYYVYGKDANGALKYLGRGGEMMPYSAKYYISTAKLDLVDNSSIDEDLPTDPVPEDNFNPSTGI